MKNILAVSILSLVALTLATESLYAVNVATANNDLILSFQATSSPGNTINLEVDLGPVDSYYNPTGEVSLALAMPVPVTNIGHLSVLDLQSVTNFGASWFTRTDLTWGIVGTSAADGSSDGIYPTNTIFMSRPETSSLVRSTPWNRVVNNGAANTSVKSMQDGLGTSAVTANSNDSSIVTKASTNSYSTRQSDGLGLTFNLIAGVSANDMPVATFGSGTYISVQDLYALKPGSSGTPGDYLGSFGLRANGTIDYLRVPAVPEPTTMVLGLVGIVTCGFGRFRNRR